MVTWHLSGIQHSKHIFVRSKSDSRCPCRRNCHTVADSKLTTLVILPERINEPVFTQEPTITLKLLSYFQPPNSLSLSHKLLYVILDSNATTKDFAVVVSVSSRPKLGSLCLGLRRHSTPKEPTSRTVVSFTTFPLSFPRHSCLALSISPPRLING